ncbi:unnamed protein product [Cylicostephanus goldi]|uniref:Uncharacterized protein n=1 Tax=Cylicostephanus goldi TaxID=71465 RepID=A0A3P6RMX2_CYLGO|nr:unnamed protein product [Cylicostephanus goldi]
MIGNPDEVFELRRDSSGCFAMGYLVVMKDVYDGIGILLLSWALPPAWAELG